MSDKTTPLFDIVGQEWHRYYDNLRAGVKVLVVDDDAIVYEVVEAVMASAGWQVEVAETAEEAWELIQRSRFGLLVADKNLPGMSGVELIAKVKEAGIDLPSLVITGYASVESVSNALVAGASDYITKPFDDIEHLRSRAMSVVERSLLTRLYDHIVKDLSGIVSRGGSEQALVRRIGGELFAFKRELSQRPDLMLVAAENHQTADLAECLRKAGHTLCVEHDQNAAIAALSAPSAPIAAIVSLQLRFPVTLVAELRNQDPLLNVVVTSSSPRLADALAAVEAGASDFFLQAVERIEALEVRARRAVENSHRARLYLLLISILHREATEQGHQVAATLWDLLPEAHREYLQRATQTIVREPPEFEVDISDLFVDTRTGDQRERRRHLRTSAGDVEVWFRPRGSDIRFARGWLRDISRGGFFLQANPPLGRGTELEAYLLVRGESPGSAVKVVGRVVRTEVHEPDLEKLSGNGVLASEESQPALEGLVDRLSIECAQWGENRPASE